MDGGYLAVVGQLFGSLRDGDLAKFCNATGREVTPTARAVFTLARGRFGLAEVVLEGSESTAPDLTRYVFVAIAPQDCRGVRVVVDLTKRGDLWVASSVVWVPSDGPHMVLVGERARISEAVELAERTRKATESDGSGNIGFAPLGVSSSNSPGSDGGRQRGAVAPRKQVRGGARRSTARRRFLIAVSVGVVCMLVAVTLASLVDRDSILDGVKRDAQGRVVKAGALSADASTAGVGSTAADASTAGVGKGEDAAAKPVSAKVPSPPVGSGGPVSPPATPGKPAAGSRATAGDAETPAKQVSTPQLVPTVVSEPVREVQKVQQVAVKQAVAVPQVVPSEVRPARSRASSTRTPVRSPAVARTSPVYSQQIARAVAPPLSPLPPFGVDSGDELAGGVKLGVEVVGEDTPPMPPAMELP